MSASDEPMTPTPTGAGIAADNTPPDRLLSSVVSAMADCVAEVERLRAALGFYASPSNWSVDGTICAPSPHSRYRPDCGDTARAALAPKEPSE